MPRKVLGGLIQCAAPITDPSAPIEKVMAGGDRRAHPVHRGSRQAGRADPRPAGGLQRPLLLPVAGPALVRHGRSRAGPDHASGWPQYAKKYKMAMVVPVYERELAGVYYNTAAVIDADGTYLGKYRKNHIPQTTGFWEKYFFKPGNLGYPVFQTRYAKIGVYICYDRHFPEGARLLGPERRRDRLQPVGHRGRPLAVPLEARAAGARRRQRLLHGLQQPRRHRSAVEHRQVLRHVVLRRPARQLPRRRLRGQGRARHGRDGPRHDRGGPPRLAVLSRPPARDLRRRWPRSDLADPHHGTAPSSPRRISTGATS